MVKYKKGVFMKDKILKKLSEIEKVEGVKIIHAVESGSRAWGFASPDSDYDVRFIYVRDKNYYLQINEYPDVINYQLDDVYDINGWDVIKALRLLKKSNPTLFEWNNSPIVYKTTTDWQKVSSVINEFFVKKSGVYHYLNMAKSNNREFLKGETVKLKKYFYVLRPILACKWILSEGTPPPMPFKTLVDKYLTGEVKTEVINLYNKKINSVELSTDKRIDLLNEYIDKELLSLETEVKNLNGNDEAGYDKLNALFLSLLDKELL